MADDKFVSRLLLIGLAVVILAILITQYMNMKPSTKTTSDPLIPCTKPVQQQQLGKEYFSMPTMRVAPPQPVMQEAIYKPTGQQPMPNELSSNEMYKAVDFNVESKIVDSCAPRDKNTVQDLLPKDAANSKWAQANPAGTGSVTDQNFLSSGYLAGINTVGQTLKNPNYQLRSDPPIEKANVGPWQQSTIEYDVNRRFFEIGGC